MRLPPPAESLLVHRSPAALLMPETKRSLREMPCGILSRKTIYHVFTSGSMRENARNGVFSDRNALFPDMYKFAVQVSPPRAAAMTMRPARMNETSQNTALMSGHTAGKHVERMQPDAADGTPASGKSLSRPPRAHFTRVSIQPRFGYGHGARLRSCAPERNHAGAFRARCPIPRHPPSGA